MKTGKFFWMMVLSVSHLLFACGGGTPDSSGIAVSYTVGGTVSALISPGLVLQDNGVDDLAIAANSSSFTFPTKVVDGEGYNVTVKTQPDMQFCLVTQGNGTISGANVTNIVVTCADYVHQR